MADVDEDLPPWAADEAPADRQPERSRRWLLGMAALPWLVVVGLVAAGTVPRSTPDAAGTAADATSGEEATPAAGASGSPQTTDPPDPETTPAVGPDDRGSWAEDPESEDPDRATGTGEPDTGDTTGAVPAVALAAARAWLTDVGPAIEIEGIEPHRDRYLEHAVVEQVDAHGDHAVVRLLAVVLVRDAERYTRVESRRLAVPVALGHPPRPAGAPWWLDEVELAVTAPEPLKEVDEPEELLSLSEALAAAGLHEPELVGASRTSDGWWLARLATDEAPGDPSVVWLRPGPQGPVLAGAPRRPDPTPEAEEEP